jgi:hypothetical protein
MDPRAENQVTKSETVSANVALYIHKHQEGADYDRHVPNLPHAPDTRTVLRGEPVPDFAYRGAPTFRKFWWHNNNRPKRLLRILSQVHWAIFLCMTATTLRKFRPSLPLLALHRVL